MKFPTEVSSIRLYGSRARGDFDAISDFDILIVQREMIPLVQRYDLESQLTNANAHTSFSWYGEAAITRMFHEGHLFAWHLYKESVELNGFVNRPDFVDTLKKPNPYRDA